MKYYYITFRSVTFAQRGERVLTDGGIRCSLQRTPKWMEAQGCGYALRVWSRDMQVPLALLQQSKVPVRRVYLQREDGQLEEMQP